jgi:hypothetical protein
MSSFFTTSSPHSTLQRRLCNKTIKFDDRRVSHRTGKNAATNEPHDCPVWKGSQQYQSQQQQQPEPQQQKGKRYVKCSKNCGGEIYFDVNNRTSSGKWIPLDKQTELPHQRQQQY